MRVTIKGDLVKSDNFKQIVDSLNEEFAPLGIRIKNATCYFRFVNEAGELVEPVNQHGNEISRIITFKRTVVIPEEEKKPKELKPKKK